MAEQDVIERSVFPKTHADLLKDLCALGVQADVTILVHSSLSALGWVSGGEVAVIAALLEAVGVNGTLIMPTHTTNLSEPSKWNAPPVPAEWFETIRQSMSPFDPGKTPTCGMGRIPECFRTWPGVRRSGHPNYSFSAFGPNAGTIVQNHTLESSMGDRSPLGRLYDLNAQVLLLGVGFGSCTCFHLAESRILPNSVSNGAPILVDGVRQWATYSHPLFESDRFPEIGQRLLDQHVVKSGAVGAATAHLFSLAQAVDLATDWLLESIPAL